MKSAISNVKDQLSLDYAEGTYLNNIGSNLGVSRPAYGFSDDTWRALAKTLALEPKQIANKFRDVLAILYGPSKTVATVLDQDAAIGDTILYLKDVSKLPQLGTLILDEGTSVEETVTYRFLDKTNNSVILTSELQYNHSAYATDAEAYLLSINNAGTQITVSDSSSFPSSGYPYPIVVSLGEGVEEVAYVVSNDSASNAITISPALSNVHPKPIPSSVSSTLAQTYTTSSSYIVLGDSSRFPNQGLLRLRATTVYTASTGTTTSVSVGVATFPVKRLSGYEVHFIGNVTAALAGKVGYVFGNTTTSLQFNNSLGAAPVAGDQFYIAPQFVYTRNDYDDDALLLSRVFELTGVSSGISVESLQANTVKLSKVKATGAGWDVIQSTPKLLELLIPSSLEEPLNLRSAAYIHGKVISPTPSTTLSVGAVPGDEQLTVVSNAAFPLVGVVTVNGVDRFGYWKSSTNILNLTEPVSSSYGIGVTAVLYQPAYGGTDLLIGDPNQTADTFSGPYLYDLVSAAPTGVTGNTTLTEILPGATQITQSQIAGATSLEVVDASHFELVSFPYTVLVGADTGNREVVTVTDVNLKSRYVTTLSADALPGDTSIFVTSVSLGGAGDASNLPAGGGYRLVLNRSTSIEEVVYVTSSSGTQIFFSDPLTTSHFIGDSVELVSDVLTVNTLSDVHIGSVSYAQRTSTWPTLSSTDFINAEKVQPQISEVTVASGVGFNASGGTLILNFGRSLNNKKSRINSSVSLGATTITLVSTAGFPTTYPYVITVGKGFRYEEKHIVTNNNTGTNTLTINGGTYGVTYPHGTTEYVELEPGVKEELDYNSLSGNTFSFSPPIVLSSNHYPSETVIESSLMSDPSSDGYGFVLSAPPSLGGRLSYIIDLIKAAGIQVEIITAR